MGSFSINWYLVNQLYQTLINIQTFGMITRNPDRITSHIMYSAVSYYIFSYLQLVFHVVKKMFRNAFEHLQNSWSISPKISPTKLQKTSKLSISKIKINRLHNSNWVFYIISLHFLTVLYFNYNGVLSRCNCIKTKQNVVQVAVSQN